MTAKNLMIQGTASSVGKSIITAGLCRIFRRDGFRVAPFKSQNMALNSFVTGEGHEMGRAQVVQAEACGLEPSSLMNPVLLKPTGEKNAQVIINGRVYGNMSAMEYHNFKPRAKEIVREAYHTLAGQYEIIVLEGAGSPAEINLRENDIVNMGMAEIAGAPVVLVGDIDRGGVFASVAGTLLLLDDNEKKRIKGVIINKFRGDIEILKPGLAMLEEIIRIPVLGVVPYMDLKIEDEDSVTERFRDRRHDGEITIDVIRLPRISNFTDFDIFRLFPDVSLKFVRGPGDIGDPDVIMIPGTKNTIDDMLYVRKSGLEERIREHHKMGKPVIGICGGYQMLGDIIEDPHNIESSEKSVRGMGLLPMTTILSRDKVTAQVKGTITAGKGLLAGLQGMEIGGYEIHMGITTGELEERGFLKTDAGICGIMEGNIMGTYMHGFFDSHDFTRGLLNNIRKNKGLEAMEDVQSYKSFKEQELDRLADTLVNCLDMKAVYGILNGNE